MKLKSLKTNFLGRNVSFYTEIDSTQAEIWREINENRIVNGRLVYCDIQTHGVGTHGRIWHTDESNNVAFSFYIEVNSNLNNFCDITLETAKIIISILKSKYGISLDIKEPNDIYCNGKKVGGILTECKSISGKIKYFVIGIGLNTNKTSFSDDIKNCATSIKNEFGINIEREEFISEFCNKFELEIVERIK